MSAEQQPLNALPQGHRLQEYELVRVLGFDDPMNCIKQMKNAGRLVLSSTKA